jgi:hypothetical protein
MKRGRSLTQLDNSSHQIKEPKQKGHTIEHYEYRDAYYESASLIKIDDTWWSSDGQELDNNHGMFIWDWLNDYGLTPVEHIPGPNFSRYVRMFLEGPKAIKSIETYWGNKVVDKVIDTLRLGIEIPDLSSWGISEIREYKDCFMELEDPATNDFWSLMKKCLFSQRLTERWDIWIPDGAFAQGVCLDWLLEHGAVRACRYIIKGGDKYTDLRDYLSEIYESHPLVQDIFMGGEMKLVVYVLWAMCYIKDMPKNVFHAQERF